MCGHTPGKVAGRQETVKAEMNGLTPCLLYTSHIRHLDVIVELHTVIFQIFDHRQDHGLILIVLGEPQSREIRQDVYKRQCQHFQTSFLKKSSPLTKRRSVP